MPVFFILVEVAPYWNVNLKTAADTAIESLVEVAPYWNVNTVLNLAAAGGMEVEVAPYWNVNTKSANASAQMRVGRSSSILECKLYRNDILCS